MQLSYNKLKTFGECALKYRLAYVERLPRPPIKVLGQHRRLHAALRQYHHFAARDGIVGEAELLGAYDKIQDVAAHPDIRATREYQEGAAILRQYCRLENQKQRVPVHLEHSVKFAFGPYYLTGKIDRLDYTSGSAYSILDYKLDRVVPDTNAAATSRQLSFYHLLVEEGLGKPVENVSLYFLRPGIEQVSTRSAAQQRETVAWIDASANAIHSEKAWKPTRGNGCLTCPYARVCPARTGEPRKQATVWQQGEMLWEMSEENETTAS